MSTQPDGHAPRQIDMAKQLLDNTLSNPPIAQLIGFEIEPVTKSGQATVTLQAGPQHTNPMGTVHGGIFCDIADAAMGIACASTLAPGETFTTLELKINYLRPVWESKLTATGRVIEKGKTITLVECDITDEKGRRVAHAISTCMILRGEKAAGR